MQLHTYPVKAAAYQQAVLQLCAMLCVQVVHKRALQKSCNHSQALFGQGCFLMMLASTGAQATGSPAGLIKECDEPRNVDQQEPDLHRQSTAGFSMDTVPTMTG